MEYEHWVLNAAISNNGHLCFTPIRGDIKSNYEIIAGYNLITTLEGIFPTGKIVAIIHNDDNAVDKWIKKNQEVEGAILLHNGKICDNKYKGKELPIKTRDLPPSLTP